MLNSEEMGNKDITDNRSTSQLCDEDSWTISTDHPTSFVESNAPSESRSSYDEVVKVAMDLESWMQVFFRNAIKKQRSDEVEIILKKTCSTLKMKRNQAIFNKVYPNFPRHLSALVDEVINALMELTGEVVQYSEIQKSQVVGNIDIYKSQIGYWTTVLNLSVDLVLVLITSETDLMRLRSNYQFVHDTYFGMAKCSHEVHEGNTHRDGYDPVWYCAESFYRSAHRWIPYLSNIQFQVSSPSFACYVYAQNILFNRQLWSEIDFYAILMRILRTTRQCDLCVSSIPMFQQEPRHLLKPCVRALCVLEIYISNIDPALIQNDTVMHLIVYLCSLIGVEKRQSNCNIHSIPINDDLFLEIDFQVAIMRTINAANHKWKSFLEILPKKIHCVTSVFRFLQERSSQLGLHLAKKTAANFTYVETSKIAVWIVCPFPVVENSCGNIEVIDRCDVCGGETEKFGYICVCSAGKFALPDWDATPNEVRTYPSLIQLCHALHISCALLLETLRSCILTYCATDETIEMKEVFVERVVLTALGIIRLVDPTSISGSILVLHVVSFLSKLLQLPSSVVVQNVLEKCDGWKVILYNLPLFEMKSGLLTDLCEGSLSFLRTNEEKLYVCVPLKSKSGSNGWVVPLTRIFFMVQTASLDCFKKAYDFKRDIQIVHVLLNLSVRYSHDGPFVQILIGTLSQFIRCDSKYMFAVSDLPQKVINEVFQLIDTQITQLTNRQTKCSQVYHMSCLSVVRCAVSLLSYSHQGHSMSHALFCIDSGGENDLNSAYIPNLRSIIMVSNELLHHNAFVSSALQILKTFLRAAISTLNAQNISRKPFLKEIFSVYIQKTSQLNEDEATSPAAERLVELLCLILDEVKESASLPALQNLLRESSLFLHLFNMFYVRPSKSASNKMSLYRKILKVITLVMRKNRKSKLEFREMLIHKNLDRDRPAYEKLYHLVSTAEGHTPSWLTMKTFLDMMCDGDFVESNHAIAYRIRNPDVVPILFQLFPLCKHSNQIMFLDCFVRFIETHNYRFCLLNRNICAYVQPAILDQLINMIPTCSATVQSKLLDVLGSIGSHSISVRQLKQIFRMIQIEKSLTGLLVAGMSRMATCYNVYQRIDAAQRPARFFFFDGETSGLHIKSLSKWPAGRGFSFCTWINLQLTDGNFQVIFSFVDAREQGCRLLLRNGQLIYEIVNRALIKTGVTLSLRKWYFVGISHSAPSFRNTSTFNLYLNGMLQYHNSVPFVEFANEVTHCHIGTCRLTRWDSEKQLLPHLSTASTGMHLHALMGTVYFFKKPLSNSSFREIFELGPDKFIATGLEHKDDKILDKESFRDLSKEIMLSYNPSIWEGDLFLDSTPEKDLSYLYGEASSLTHAPHAIRMDGTHHIYTRALWEVVDCIGGIQVLLPIFALYDDINLQSATMESAKINTDLLQLIWLISKESSASKRFMIEQQGFDMIQYLLSRVSPSHMNSSIIRLVVDILKHNNCDYLGTENHIEWSNILADSSLWVQSSLDAHQKLFESIYELLKYDFSKFSKLFPLSKFLDDLRVYYYLRSTPVVLAHDAHDDLTNGTTRICSPLDLVARRKVRGKILDIIRLIIKYRSLSLVDVQYIFGFLTNCEDDEQRCDLLDVLQGLFPENNAKLAEEFVRLGRELIFGIGRDLADQGCQESVLCGAIDIIYLCIFHRTDVSRAYKRQAFQFLCHLFSAAYIYSNDASCANSAEKNDSIWNGLGITPSLALSHIEFAIKIYIETPEEAVEILEKLAFINLTQSLSPSATEHVENMCGFELSNSFLLPILLDVIRSCNEEIRLKVMTQFRNFTISAKNAELLTNTAHDWHVSLFRILADVSSRSKLVDVVLVTVSQLILYLVERKVVELTLTMTRQFSNCNTSWGWEWFYVVLNSARDVLGFHNWTWIAYEMTYTYLLLLQQRNLVNGTFMFFTTEECCTNLRSNISDVLNYAQQVMIHNHVYTSLIVEHMITFSSQDCCQTVTTRQTVTTWQLIELLYDIFLVMPISCPLNTRECTMMLRLGITSYTKCSGGFILARLLCFQIEEIMSQNNQDNNKIVDAMQLLERLISGAEKTLLLGDDALYEIFIRLARLSRLDFELRNRWIFNIIRIVEKLLKKSKAMFILKLLDALPNRDRCTCCTDTHDPVQNLAQSALNLNFCSKDWYRKFHTKKTTRTEIWYCELQNICQNETAKAKLRLVHQELLTRVIQKDGCRSEHLSNLLILLQEKEKCRWRKILLENKQRRYHAVLAWQRVLRSVTNETSPWGSLLTDIRLVRKPTWKISRTEDQWRRRLHIKQDAQFASLPLLKLKDASSFLDGSKPMDAHLQLSLANELVQARVLSSYGAEIYKKLMELPEIDLEGDINCELSGEAPYSTLSKHLCTYKCELVHQIESFSAVLYITTEFLTLDLFAIGDDKMIEIEKRRKRKKYRLQVLDLTVISFREYFFHLTALEFFFCGGKSLLLNFFSFKTCVNVDKKIRSLGPRKLEPSEGHNPRAIIEKSSLTNEWVQRKISNFEYLSRLNTIAGRTCNNLAQYPIFPWILADYASQSLDLTNPKTFRDLRRPIGVQSDVALREFEKKYVQLSIDHDQNAQFVDVGVSRGLPPFHFGSHYSCAGFVIGFLMRLEPFTTYHRRLQKGKFDHPDRLFDSIEATYRSCTTNPHDVRELIPEFFYMPEFLTNQNNLDFGVKQNGTKVDNVKLPNWAKSPEDFIRIHRMALESEYVSQNLHHWIDLIFGFKQRPPMFGGTQAAVDACNVYFHLTYGGAVNLEMLRQKDFALYSSTVEQINCFGQTPRQLFFCPHPSRLPPSAIVYPMFSPVYMGSMIQPRGLIAHPRYKINTSNRGLGFLHLDEENDMLIIVDSQRYVSVCRWKSLPPDSEPPFQIEFETNALSQVNQNSTAAVTGTGRVGVPFATNAVASYTEYTVLKSSLLFAYEPKSRWLISCGHWDHSVRITGIDERCSFFLYKIIYFHRDVVTCIGLTENGNYLVTGSTDNTVAVWEINSIVSSKDIQQVLPLHTFYGHDDGVTCVDACSHLDLVVSCGRDGSVIFHSLKKGKFIRAARVFNSLTHAPRLTWIGISASTYVICYCESTATLHLYSINGKYLQSALVGEKLECFTFSKDGSVLIAGGNGILRTFKTFDLSEDLPFSQYLAQMNLLSFDVSVQSLLVSVNEMHLLVGLSNGELAIFTSDAQYLRERFQKKLDQLGF